MLLELKIANNLFLNYGKHDRNISVIFFSVENIDVIFCFLRRENYFAILLFELSKAQL